MIEAPPTESMPSLRIQPLRSKKKQQIAHLVVEMKHELICLEDLPAKAVFPPFLFASLKGAKYVE